MPVTEGRIVWAHENIFGNVSVDLVEPTPHIPFMLVLSCYNGYFDQPGEPSMAGKAASKREWRDYRNAQCYALDLRQRQ